MDQPADRIPRRRRRRRVVPPPGSVPGTFTIPDDAPRPAVVLYTYSAQSVKEEPVSDVSALPGIIQNHPHLNHWVEIRGMGDRLLIEKLGEGFRIHPLTLADVVNSYQRPKMEEFDQMLFIISRVVYAHNGSSVANDQVSVFLGKNFVISIEEQVSDRLNPVRERLLKGKGYLRSLGPDFLAYAITDNLLDFYFPLLDLIGGDLDKLEEEILTSPPRQQYSHRIQALRKQLILIRRTVWQERDKVNDMLRTASPLITPNTKLFIRDAYDHTIQLIDIIDNYREIVSSLMEIYLSSVSNRMNQVMKTLAIISTIFIPLTFIVGVYGMNFARENPETGEVMKWSMPELYSPYGYAGIMAFMVVIVLIQLIIFYKKGWLKD